MFSLRSNALPGAVPPDPPPDALRLSALHAPTGDRLMMADATLARKTRGGRPKSDPTTIRTATIGVRVSASEYARLREKACQLGITPAQWLREAALSRRLPPPPVPAVNREHYAELARLSANLNQLAKAANESRPVIVSTTLLNKLTTEVKRLRFALIGVEADP